jgi:hypothetical protein
MHGAPIEIVGCETMYSTEELSPAELETLLAALERATTAARHTGSSRRLPRFTVPITRAK